MELIALDEKKYRKLVSKVLPKKIETEEEYERFLGTLAALSFPERKLPPEEDALSDLLEQLINEYENRTVKMPSASPLECLEFLMEQNGLRQVDMISVFGTGSVVSEVLSGKRHISKTHALRLAERFRVGADVFL